MMLQSEIWNKRFWNGRAMRFSVLIPARRLNCCLKCPSESDPARPDAAGIERRSAFAQVKNIPVIVISAKATVQDKVNLLLGGGDLNGIVLLVPEWAARSGFGVLLLVNGLVFWKRVLPVYSRSFSDTEVQA